MLGGRVVAAHQHSLLIVDDHDDLRQGMATLLERHGHRATGVPGGHEALARLRQGLRPCVIVLDMAMPDMPGQAFRDAQRSDPELARIPVIVVSAGDEVSEERARTLGIQRFFRKPVQLDRFLRAIDEECGAGQRPGS